MIIMIRINGVYGVRARMCIKHNAQGQIVYTLVVRTMRARMSRAAGRRIEIYIIIFSLLFRPPR